jgi:TatA/E family protein of Tat protein translocase
MFTPGNLLLTTAVVLLLVGSKKIRTLGEDLGVAIKNFREATSDKNKTDNNHSPPEE